MKQSKPRQSKSFLRRDELVAVLRRLSERSPDTLRESAAWWSMLKEAEASLAEVLRDDPSVEEFRAEHIRFEGHGLSRLSITSLINWLMDRAMRAGPDETVADIERYLNAKTFPCRFSIGIRGVTTATPLQLADDVELLPHSDDVASFEPLGKPPMSTAALTVVADLPNITAPSTDSSRVTRAEAAGAEAFERLQIARMCVAIVLNSRIVETIRTADTPAAVPKSGGRSATSAAFPANVPIRELSANEFSSIRDLHGRLLAAPNELRDRLVVALHRWHALFLKNGVNADFFIDLGIGLESVFVSDGGPEIRYRLGVRGARLLGGSTVASRKHMFRILSTLYEARSTAVHSGRILEKIPSSVAPTTGHLAMDGEELLRRAIITMIYRGKDDWEDLVFS